MEVDYALRALKARRDAKYPLPLTCHNQQENHCLISIKHESITFNVPDMTV